MAKDIKKAQTGINIPPMANVPSPTSSNQSFMQERFGGYREPGNPRPMPNISTRPNLGVVKPNNGNQPSGLDLLLRDASTRGDRGKGDRITTADEYEGADRYDYFQPSSMGVDNEDMAGQYQSLGSKAVNGVTKGLILAGTTFIQGTAGLVNGVYQAIDDGKFSSFYDNEFNRGLDEINKWSEDAMPNYYTAAERDANFYSPKYWATGNFVFDGVIKNLGFAAGAYLTGGAYTNVLKALPGTSRLFSMGKAAETLAATEKGLSAANKGAGVYGEIKALSDSFLAQYNLLNPAGRAVVAGLSTTGEAGIEALHNSNEFRQELIDEFKKEYGVVPGAEQMDNINAAVEGAGNASFYANVGILTASNYVIFPRIARSSFKADKRAINGLVREIDDIAYEGGKYAAKTSKLHPVLRTLNNIRPYTFTVSEGLEEVSQYGSSVGTQDYYNKQYNNEATSWLTSIGVGLTKGVFSDEGAKNALIGGLSGGIMTGRGRYRRNQQRAADTAEAIELLNDFQLSDFTKESIYSNNRAGVLGEELEQAAERGDMLSYKNLESQYIINYLTPRIKYGRLDLVMQDIADMKKLSSTEQGFAQLVAEGKVQEGETKETFIARLENFKQTANDVNSLYQSLELRYGGITEEGVDGKRYRTYGPAVINKMIYAASTVADTDSRIPQLSAELQAAIPTLNIQEILQDLISGEVESFNNAVNQIQNLDILSDKKDVLGEKLNDVAALAKIRELMLQEYELIKTNPKNFQEKPLRQQDSVKTYEEILEDDANTFVIKAKNGEQSLQIGQEYFVGQGVNFEGETPLDEPVVISSFVPVGQNEDGTIQIKDQSGQVRDISPDVLLDYNVGRKSTLVNNKTANFYYRHRDKVFEFNFGKNFGGKRKGRLMYDNGKLFFVYKDSNGTILKKELANKFFAPQPGFDQARITPVGKVTAEQQDAANQFLSPEELAKNEQTLQSNRENRLKIMNDLGVESKRRLEEINKQLEKDRKKLAIIKKDLESIYTMKEGGSRIKLTYSKAQKNFTRAINNYTAMQQDTQDRITELEREQEELDLNTSYFEAFEVDLLDLPGNTKEFLKELKDQLSLLEQNGKAVNNEIKANKKLLDSIKKATKKAAKLLKSALETTYVYDEDYGDYLKDLLEKSVTGEDLLNTWPLLKQELANFNLTNDIQKETNVSERDVFDALESRKELEATLESLRKEYVAKKVIVDRFQRVMDEYVVEKQNQDKIANNTKLLADLQQTANTGPVTDAEPKSFDPISKKSNDVIPRASVGEPTGPIQDHQVRANTFGVNLNKFANRKNIRAIYLTLKTQDQKLDGVVQRILDNGSPELMEKFGDSIIVMVMIDTAGNLVGVDGQPIPNTKNQLDNAIYQTIPESSLTNTKGSLFRVEDSETAAIKKQFGVFRKGILDRNMVGVPFKIEASFGIPQYEQDSNGNNVLGTTSVVEADLISETDLSKTNVIFIPTTNKNIFKGTVTYSQPFGSVFLDLPNGYVKLRNRKHTTQEAEAIYDSLHALSKEIVDLDKGATSDTSVRLFNFLKGVTYWGIPVDTNGNRKATGQNSVFFEREIGESISGINFTKLSLKMGAFPSVDFNPVSISKNKEFIIETLGQMYNNIDNSNLKNIDQSFEQITKINENGTIESITWPNYQTYLLSKNIPGGGTRQDFQLPLHTTMKPVVEGSDEVNRRGVYFVNEDSAEDFISEVVPPKSTRIQVISPKGPAAPAQQTSEVEVVTYKGTKYSVDFNVGSGTITNLKTGKVLEGGVTSPVGQVVVDLAIAQQDSTPQTSEVEVVLDNKQTNTFTSPKGKKILFKASPSTTAQNYKEKGQISVMMNDDLKQLLAENPDAATQEKIKKSIKYEIYNYIAPELAKLKEQDAEDEMQMTPEMFDQIMAARKQKGKSSPSSDVLNALKNGRNNQNNEVLREVVTESIEGMSEENWKDARAWMSKNLPGVSFNRVKNIIKTKDGKKAWGFFENNSIYVYENAEVGTVYHEAFEAVFAQFLSPQEKEKLFNEFTSRKGTFVDRPTGRTVKYSQATRDEMREQLAEDFRDYIQDKKKPEGGFFSRVFKQLKDLIEKWFLSPQSQTYSNELFDKIDGGGFVSLDYLPLLPFGLFNSYDTVDFATPGTSAVFRVETGLSDVQVHDTIEHMTYLTLRNIIANNESLFSVPELNQTELYSRLKGEVLASVGQVAQQYKDIRPQFEKSTGGQLQEIDNKIDETVDLMQRIDDSWTYLTKKHKEYILSFGITFDEADQLQLEEDRSNKGYNSDATKIDNFKKTGAAVKLLLATVPVVTVNENADVRFSPSTINGVKLLPVTQTFITVLENVSNATSMENMLEKLRDVALNDPNYLSLYKRLSGRSANEGAVSLDNITERHQLTLLAALFKTFKKQNPIVKIVNVLENGETVVSEANLSTASRQMSQQYLNSIVTTSKRGNGIFKQVGGVFNPDTKKLSKYPLNTLQNMFNFLGELGIPFNAKEYNNFDVGQKKRFASAVNGIKKSIEQSKDIKFFSTKSLNFAGQILNLATLKVIATNPEVSSTYFNIDGERVQTYIGTNAASEVHNFMTSVGNKQELGDTPYSYLLTDVFAQNSTIIERIYDAEGNLRTDKVNLFKPGYAGGILNGQKGTAKGSSQLQFPDRLRQELNQNINGQYLNLVPGDSSLEHTLEMGNPITERDIVSGGAVLNTVMKGYFLSEVELAREKRDIVEIDNRQTSDLRFFKEILGEELHEEIRQNVLDPALTAEQVYELSVDKIIDATSSYIQRNKNQYATFLLKYGVIQQAENEQSGELTDRYTASGVEGMTNMTIQEMDRKLLVQEVNYIISNIEMHKILYGDPYGYKDELKRIKSFLSPRQAIVNNSPQWNNRANEIWNRGLEIDTVGYTKFTRDYFRTVTGGDVKGVIDIPNYKAYTETDGGGIISIKAYRNFRIRTADWNDAQESQYRYDIAWYKRHKSLPLSKSEKDLLKEGNPQVQSTYVTLKPIVSGAKLDKDGSVSANNNVVLDKYALYPLSYRVMHEINPTSNTLKLYDKMQKEDIDYLVFESGRKVGAEGIHDTYNDDGEFNNAEYESVINIPFNIISLQSEVPSKEDGRVTRASQITKLITLDYLDNGMPIDYKGALDQWLTLTEEQKQKASVIYAEIQNNTKLLDEMTKEGLNVMMKKLGITRVGNAYKVTDLAPAAKTLREELFKRETNDNISDALDGFLMGDAVLEATQSYNQIRNILYSIVQKSIVRPKINGGQKVQIPSALFESTRTKKTTINGKIGYTSEVLKFYNNSKGENVMEVMVGRWFGSSLSDEALLEYLNNTEEGQKILRGVAFRIPTQKQNSIDAIKIKQFLPKEFGDNVVVPAALVEKVGSDFDIDKLFMYLKNVTYINNELQLIPFYGYGEQSKKRFGELFDAGSLLNKAQQKELQAQIDLFESGELEGDLIEAIFGETFDNQDVIDDYILELKDKGIRQTVIDRMYMRSLENEFIQSTENLITFPENYERLTVPNDASQLEELSKEIVDKTKESAFNYRNVGNLLNRRFMARLRNAFVQGKRGIGIAAVNQTNLALNQHSPVFVELNSIKFRRKNTVNIPDNGEMISLSGVKNKAEDYISDINGQVIDGMVDISAGPWIIELGITPATASTWLYLIKAGVPIDSVAYFMNQPIIIDYLNKIEESGYTWLFIEDFANELKENKYDSPSNLTSAEKQLLPDSNALRSQLGKTTFSNKDAAYQRLILDEFLNYAKQAQDLFEVTQGTNWDTSTFNDPLLIFKKEEQYLNALQKPIFSYVDGKVIPAAEALVQTTFLKETILSLTQARNGIANFLTSDQDRSRTILQKVLRPYINRSDRDFIKISRAATNSFFDYAVQTDQNLNMFLKSLLIDKDGIAFQVDKFVEDVLGNPSHPLYENQVVRLLESDPNKRVGDVANNIKLRNNDRKVYEQNSIIYAFRQLKEELGDGSNLYSNILISSILQSGLNNSPISFTSLLPYEDFQKIYNETLSTLEKNPNLNDFYELGMFERNNWSAGSGIVPSKKAPWIQTDQGKRYNPAMLYLPKNIKASTATKAIPQLVTIGTGTREGQSDYITYSWNSGSYDAKQRKEMASKGDFSFINKALFKKIKSGDEGFIHSYKQKKTGKLMEYFVYKHINALGDSYRAQEYYINAKPSVFDNGLLKAEEKQDVTIIEAWKGKAAVRPVAQKNDTSDSNQLVTKTGAVYKLSLSNATYSEADINTVLLTELGYTEEQAGEIFEEICKI